MSDVALVCCGVFQAGVTALVDHHLVEATPYFVDTAQHDSPEALNRALTRALAVASRNHERLVVLFGCCLPQIDQLVEEYGAVRVEAESCLDLLTGDEPLAPDHLHPDRPCHKAVESRRPIAGKPGAVLSARLKQSNLYLAIMLAITRTQVRQLEGENVRLKTRLVDLRRSNAELTMVDAVNRELSNSLDLEAVARRLVNMVVELTGGAQASLLIAGSRGERMRCVGVSDNVKFPLTNRAISAEAPARFVLEGRMPLVVKDLFQPVGDACPPQVLALLARHGVSSYVGLPMLAGERCVAVLQAFNLPFPDHAEEYARTLSGVAPVAAMAFQNAMLFNWVARERDKFGAIFSKVSDGIRVVDSSYRIVQFNEASEQLTGWRAEDAIGRHCCEVYALPGAKGCNDRRCFIRDVLRSGESVPYAEGKIATKGGQRVDIVSSFAPMARSALPREHVVAIDRNMSERVELERLKSDFVARASHELRTPLTSIRGYAETLLRRDLRIRPSLQREFLEAILAASDRLGEMADDLTHVSRIDTAELHVRRLPVALGPLLDKVVRQFQLRSEKHRLAMDCPETLPTVLADPDRLADVVVNLISNAIKYSPDGGSVEISARLTPDTGDSAPVVVVSVRDQGIGIPMPELAKIFQRFYRVSNALTTSTPGIGLGLSICRTYVESMGGTIWVDSVPGQGSTFSFSLPTTKEDGAQ